MRKFWGMCVLALAFSCSARAQGDVPKAEIFGGYSYTRVDRGSGLSGINMNGWNAAVTGNVNSWLGVTADFSGHYGSPGGVGQNRHSFLFGPKLSYRASQRFTPFAQALFGAVRAHRDAFGAGFTTNETTFGMALGGGVDYNLSNRLAIRLIQADYLLTRFDESSGIVCIQAIGAPCPITQSGSQHNVRLSFGVTWRIGSR